jgi:hypothetical protein
MTMTKTHNVNSFECNKNQKRPILNIHKLGIVARDYHETKDFRKSLPGVLQLLDEKRCDAVLFSLFSLKPEYDPNDVLKGLKNIKVVFFETFVENKNPKKPPRERRDFVVYYRTPSGWEEYWLKQKFGSLAHKPKKELHDFVEQELLPNRILGNSCVLLCGESNAVKCKRDDGKVYDILGLRKAIRKEKSVEIILNPCHDYMRRPEMKKKRAYLSEGKRWVISVWCKGKGRESILPWTVFYNGKEHHVDETIRDFDKDAVFVGILNVQ